MKTLNNLRRNLVALVVVALLLCSPPKANAMYPVFDALSNTLHLKDLAHMIEQLRAQMENLAIVQQILTVNREMADIQNNISSSIGSVRDVMQEAKYYASKIKGTIDYWKNFDVKNLIPFFDPTIFESYQAFLNLKNNAEGLVSDMKGFKNIPSGTPFAYMTMEAYYNKYTLMNSIKRAQQVNRWGAEIGDARMQNEGLHTINKLTKATAREMGRIASIVNEIAFQTLDDSVNMAVIQNAKIQGYEKGFRANYETILNE